MNTPIPSGLPHARYAKPGRFNLRIFNDDFTRSGVIGDILTKVFFQPQEQASAQAYNIQLHGSGTVGPFTFEVAETRMIRAKAIARMQGLILRLEMEHA